MIAWLCLGSNQDDPEKHLKQAVSYLQEKCYIKILQTGKIHQTKPYGYIDQPDFTNQLLQVETPLNPHELLTFLKKAETELGRKPTFKWGPRVIDLDIVFYENKVINSDELILPHPGIMDRTYLLQLLNEVIPDYIHPVNGQSIRTIYQTVINKGETQ